MRSYASRVAASASRLARETTSSSRKSPNPRRGRDGCESGRLRKSVRCFRTRPAPPVGERERPRAALPGWTSRWDVERFLRAMHVRAAVVDELRRPHSENSRSLRRPDAQAKNASSWRISIGPSLAIVAAFAASASTLPIGLDLHVALPCAQAGPWSRSTGILPNARVPGSSRIPWMPRQIVDRDLRGTETPGRRTRPRRRRPSRRGPSSSGTTVSPHTGQKRR
jgi:hypothetical protein